MKKIWMCIFKICINMIYAVFKILPIKNKVVMLTRQSNEPFVDFKLLKNEFVKNDVEVVILCKKIEKGIFNKLKYFNHLLLSMYHLATSKYCIIDGYSICVSMLHHKKNLKTLQIWHALGAIKKFGYQTLGMDEGRNEKLAICVRMHKNYTYVTCSSNVTKKFYKEAFNVSENKIKILGMPRIDYLRNMEKNLNKQIYQDYPKLKNKKNIVYVPTFRKKQRIEFENLVNAIDKEKYNLIIRLHPLDKNIVAPEYKISNKYLTYDILEIADYIITDYSAIAIEAAILDKPIFFYIYDYEKYIKRRGINVDLLSEVPSLIGYNSQDIISKIENDNYDLEEIARFKQKYVETLEKDNTKNIVNLLINGEEYECVEKENDRYMQSKSVHTN